MCATGTSDDLPFLVVRSRQETGAWRTARYVTILLSIDISFNALLCESCNVRTPAHRHRMRCLALCSMN